MEEEVKGDVVKISRVSSKALAGYGAVPPLQKPEDFQKLREEFEEGVAQEVSSEAEE